MKEVQVSIDSFISSELNQSGKKLQKQPQQLKALFLKNLRLQSKQIGTNICQILTPIICLLFAYIMLTIAKQNMPFGQIYKPLKYPFWFNDYQTMDEYNSKLGRSPLQWFAYECVRSSGCNEAFLGIKDGNSSTQKGMLGNVPDSYQGNVLFKPDPFNNRSLYESVNVPFFRTSVNQSLNANLFKRLDRLPKQDNQYIKKSQGLDYLPDGALKFEICNQTKMKASIYINDVRDLQFHRQNGITVMKYYRPFYQLFNKNGKNKVFGYSDFTPAYGILSLAQIASASYILQKTKTNNSAIIKSGFMIMPDIPGQKTLVDTFINIVGALIFPIALGLMFPVFLYTVVLEKEQKLIQMMKMNGMKISNYWIVYFFFNLMLGIITNIIFFIMGYFLVDISFFTQTSLTLLFLVQLGWLLSQIGLAVFFQTFLSTARTANIVGYLISIWTIMIGSTLNVGAYQYPTQFPYILRMIPPFAFTRLFYLMLLKCSDGQCIRQISGMTPEMKDEIIFLYIGFIFFFGLGAYLYEIIPQQFGVTRSPLFPIKAFWKVVSCRFFRKKKDQDIDQSQNTICEDKELRLYIAKDKEDQFSKKQRENIFNLRGKELKNIPLIINNLRKIYSKESMKQPFVAVKSFNLKVEHKQVFGLLGPNGAGKTTLISMITGMFQPNNGNAWIGGYDIQSNVSRAQLQMGVCPQFDLLWPQLTVQEHLYFYARLKGVPGQSLDSKVKQAIEEVKLTAFSKFVSSSLSGGMKRRLSVAISLVGDPQIVFLDEPSTGLDPQNRRQLWQVLSKCQRKRSIFLTTHMMQEADTLCHRVGIITNGILRTVGPSLALKKQYGGGYQLSLSVKRQEKELINRQSLGNKFGGNLEAGNRPQDYEQNSDSQELHVDKNLKQSINSFIELQQTEYKTKLDSRNLAIVQEISRKFQGAQLKKIFNGTLLFKIPLNYKVSDLFNELEKMQTEFEIADFAITNSSLEDVFMNVVNQFDRQTLEKDYHIEPEFRLSQKKDQKINKSQIKSDKLGSVISKKRESVISEKEQPKDNKVEQDQENLREKSRKSSEKSDQ